MSSIKADGPTIQIQETLDRLMVEAQSRPNGIINIVPGDVAHEVFIKIGYRATHYHQGSLQVNHMDLLEIRKLMQVDRGYVV